MHDELLQSKLMLQRREEAYMTVDAYRIAFEEQLQKSRTMTQQLASMATTSSRAVKAKAAVKWLLTVLADGGYAHCLAGFWGCFCFVLFWGFLFAAYCACRWWVCTLSGRFLLFFFFFLLFCLLLRPKIHGYTGCKGMCAVEQAVSCI